MLAVKMNTSSSSLDNVKPRMVDGKIVWSGGPSLKQWFALPESIMYYMAKNPCTSEVYLKLIQSCKFFFEKMPLLVAADLHGKTKLCPYDEEECGENDQGCCVEIDMDKLSNKIWITNMLYLENENISTFTSLIYPKLYRCQKANLTIYGEVIQFDDFEKCAPFLTDIDLHNVQTESVMLDKLIELCPKVKTFKFFFGSNNLSMIDATTVNNICKLKNLQHLESFILWNIPHVINVEDISTFIKDHPAAKILLSFNDPISEEYKIQLEALINTVIESQVLKCQIIYSGQNNGKKKILYERYHVEKLKC
uniref:Uncharacterized protein n=1 Tax=Panagrolaimus sp. ES5 TaxID=591445 RepID=A0AC34FN86_9BILA